MIALNVARALSRSWQTSRGHGAQLMFVAVAIPWAAQAYYQHLFPRGSSWFLFLLALVFAALLTVIHLAALSFAYRHISAAITAPAPPPTDPPA
jgi:hypothetical protein